MWAGTRSLHAYDTAPAPAGTEPHPGDLLVDPGSPGHAVLLLDVARAADGAVWLLVGEGYMPAQQLHVELGPSGGWWRWSPERGLALDHWSFDADALRQWKPAPK